MDNLQLQSKSGVFSTLNQNQPRSRKPTLISPNIQQTQFQKPTKMQMRVKAVKTEENNELEAYYTEWKKQYEVDQKNVFLQNIVSFIRTHKAAAEPTQCKVAAILYKGTDQVRSDAVSAWQNMGGVAGFVGAIALSILLNPLSKSVGFHDDGKQYQSFGHTYICFLALAALY
jgi:hypothetical protein